jgi:hypothetical protein
MLLPPWHYLDRSVAATQFAVWHSQSESGRLHTWSKATSRLERRTRSTATRERREIQSRAACTGRP